MARRQACALLFCLFACLLQGCPLNWRRMSINEVITQDDVSFVMPGKTTLRQVVGQIGSPDIIQSAGTGLLIRYQFMDVKYFRVNLTRPLPFLVPALSAIPSDLYELTISGGGAGTDELQIGFDENLTVLHYSFAYHSKASHYIP
jgi:hypothetical protein